MPDDRVDTWETSSRPERGGDGARALPPRLERVVRRALPPALLVASATLFFGQLFSAYRTIWPDTGADPLQQTAAALMPRVGFVIASPSSTPVPLLLGTVPLIVLAGLAALPGSRRPPVPTPLRRVAGVTALLQVVVGVVLALGTALWTLVTRGEVKDSTDQTIYFTVDPVVTFLSRGGDGLATAVLAGVAGWLLWTRSADIASAPSAPSVPSPPTPRGAEDGAEDGHEGGRELEAMAPGQGTAALSAPPATALSAPPATALSPPPAVAGAPQPADAAYRSGSVVPGSPAPFVTRGASEPPWQHTDPTVFRRPSARPDPASEPRPDEAAQSADPAALFQRPAR